MVKRSEIVKAAKSFLGQKWVHQGRNRTGLDCAGLIVLVGRDCDLLPSGFQDFTNYQRRPDGVKFKQLFDKYADEIPFIQVQDGDIAIFGEGRYGYHCGILYKENDTLYIIHSYCERGKVVKEPFTDKWRKVLKHTYKYRGV